ncbi:hypothetical protein G4228_014004 [Cervus hanglu yarkandensis]|nr:hypothetical protein G4228_014004 [Cervus hanglu yarkandensis]
MSRLLPLLRSRTARSLRPGPAAVAAAPRPPSWCCCGRGLLALAAPGGPRALGTHPKKEPMEALNTAQGARDFIYSLHSSERSCLLKELHRFESIAIAQEKLEAQPPTPGQLRYVFIHNAIPFIGFGFLDNAIMIVAGKAVGVTIGCILGMFPLIFFGGGEDDEKLEKKN